MAEPARRRGPAPAGSPARRTQLAADRSGRRPADPSALLVDDADTFARSDADEAVRELVREGGRGQVAVVVAGPIEEMKTELRGVIAEARRARTGLLLSPSSSFDGDLVGVRLAAVDGRAHAGRTGLPRARRREPVWCRCRSTDAAPTGYTVV